MPKVIDELAATASNACAKAPTFTEQLAHASVGGAIALSVFMICIAAVVISFVVLR